jgi:hypothetical protein
MTSLDDSMTWHHFKKENKLHFFTPLYVSEWGGAWVNEWTNRGIWVNVCPNGWGLLHDTVSPMGDIVHFCFDFSIIQDKFYIRGPMIYPSTHYIQPLTTQHLKHSIPFMSHLISMLIISFSHLGILLNIDVKFKLKIQDNMGVGGFICYPSSFPPFY